MSIESAVSAARARSDVVIGLCSVDDDLGKLTPHPNLATVSPRRHETDTAMHRFLLRRFSSSHVATQYSKARATRSVTVHLYKGAGPLLWSTYSHVHMSLCVQRERQRRTSCMYIATYTILCKVQAVQLAHEAGSTSSTCSLLALHTVSVWVTRARSRKHTKCSNTPAQIAPRRPCIWGSGR